MTMQKKPFRQKGWGLALVVVLWMVMLMSVLVTLAARGSLLDTKISLVEVEKQRCRWAARGGVETAIALLDEDDRTSDSMDDLWSNNPYELEQLKIGQLDVRVQVTDAASKLNLNTVSRNQLLWIPDMTEEIADSILDWRDSNDQPRAQGAESGYYLNLPFGYQARNSRFHTLRELLRVKGVTPALLEGEDSQTLSPENQGWKHYFTPVSLEWNRDTQGQPKVNLNQADQTELTQTLSLTEQQAQWIMQNRPFRRWAELLGGRSVSGQNTPTPARAQSGAVSQTPRQQQGQATQRTGENPPENTGGPLDWETLMNIIDKSTLTSNSYLSGRINVNTASITVLTALLAGNRQLAENIAVWRQTSVSGFSSVGDLEQVEGMTREILTDLLDFITVRSSVYEIRSTAASAATNLTYTIEVLVNRDADGGQVLYWHEGVQL